VPFAVKAFAFDPRSSAQIRGKVFGFFDHSVTRSSLVLISLCVPSCPLWLSFYFALVYARPIPPSPSTSLISPASFIRFSVL
jgi:hypothetical protein